MSTRSEAVSRQSVGSARSVVLTIPADKHYVVLVRSAVGHLGTRIGLTMQELGDLRLAVNEACALFLPPEEPDTDDVTLECRFTEAEGSLVVTVAADAEQRAVPRVDVGGFGWNLLAALVDDLQWSDDRGRAEVRLVKRPRSREHAEHAEHADHAEHPAPGTDARTS
jgi:serine/threonine-protein kinase RsbW